MADLQLMSVESVTVDSTRISPCCVSRENVGLEIQSAAAASCSPIISMTFIASTRKAGPPIIRLVAPEFHPLRQHEHEPSHLRWNVLNSDHSIVKSSTPGWMAPRLTDVTGLAKAADSGLPWATTLAVAWVRMFSWRTKD